jgi:hypothetical protein
MKHKNRWLLWTAVLLLAGCASVARQRATVIDQTIQNGSLGFSGFTFQIPDGFELYRPAAKNPAEYTDLQRMAIRIYDTNKAWHPRGDELFYESFLLISEKSCFLLITLKTDVSPSLDDSPFSDSVSTSWQLMPLYNVTSSRPFEIGPNRFDAVYTRGSAHEQKGWYYASPRRGSFPFSYEACKIRGGNRDSYILMGFALPDQAGGLTAPMREMVESIQL